MIAHPCQAPLPRGPSVPAAIVLRTSCGSYRLGTDGRVVRLPRHWVAAQIGGTGPRFGAGLQVRRTRAGGFLVLRHGRLVWRSSGLYPRDGGDVAFGPGELAFQTFRQGVFLTDLKGPERLVVPGHAHFPVDFTRSGLLLVGGAREVAVVSRRGAIVRRYPYRSVNGFAFDEPTDTLFFVTPGGTLAATDGLRVRLLRTVTAIGGRISAAPSDLLVFQGRRTVVVTRRYGTRVASAAFTAGDIDAGVSVSPDGRAYAFRVTTGKTATLYALRAGASRPLAIYRHRLGPSGCGVGAGLGWNGRFLLYDSTDGDVAVLDSRGGRPRDLRVLAARLPEQNPGEQAEAFWESDLG